MRGIPFCFLLPSKYCSQIYVVNTFIILLLPILTLLVGCQEEKLSDEVMVWLCLERGAYCLHMVRLMPLPSQNPIISCLILIQTGFIFLLPSYPGCPGNEAIKRVLLLRLFLPILVVR